MKTSLTLIPFFLFVQLSFSQSCDLIGDSLINQSICIGDVVELNAMIIEGPGSTMCDTTLTFIPDGSGQNYVMDTVLSGFGGQTVLNGDDISVCLDIEHSWLGDLEMMLTCPNGASVNIFNSYTGTGLFPGGFGGGGTYLGQAFDSGSSPGTCWEYCFFNAASNPAWASGFTTVPVTIPSPGNSVMSGDYIPEETFANLVGCPLDGVWSITIRDNIAADDGYICSWCLGVEGISTPDLAWSPSATLSDIAIENPLASPDTTTVYTVVAWDPINFCSDTSEVTVFVTPPLPLNLPIIGSATATPWQTLTYSVTSYPGLVYYWTITNGSIVNGQGTSSVDVQVSDSVTSGLAVITSSLCDSITSAKTIFVGTSGVEDFPDFSFQFAPNPFNTEMNVSLSSNNVVDELQLLDLSGRVVKNVDCRQKMNVTINREGLSSGTYFIKLIGEGTSISVKRVVVY